MAQVKVTVDLKEFSQFTRKAPGIMNGLVKESFTKGAAKMRKEFHRTIDTRYFAPLQEKPQYRSKYSKPLLMLKGMIRYRVTGGNKRVTATVGIFPGKAGSSKLTNAKFKSRYGISVVRFGTLMTYGGKLRVNPADRKLFASRGFYLSNKTNYIKFPVRDWYTRTRWHRATVIVPYINKDLNERVKKRLSK